jgi:hypothetical protein
MLQKLAHMFTVPPRVIVTDRNLALMKAVYLVFPRAAPFLCQWHINNFAKARALTHFRDNARLYEPTTDGGGAATVTCGRQTGAVRQPRLP